MKLIKASLAAGILWAVLPAKADESLPMLRSGDNVYSNVTVTTVTATDIYFTYSGGIGNAKLKSLDPNLQKHFHFDPAKAGLAEKTQAAATVQFQHNLLAAKASPKLPGPTYDTGDLVAPKIFARSFRGEVPPQIFVEQWLTPTPSVEGKFVMLVFWSAAPEQCRNIIPRLNDFAAKFKDKLTVIALSNESAADIIKMKLPPINFSVGTDTQSRSFTAYEVTAIPHMVVIDPANIVRYEGPPIYLEEKDLAHLLAAYAQ